MAADGMARRRVEPEWLDLLEAEDPRALRSRRDLVRVNAWMGHARIIARQLRSRLLAGAAPRLLEIGAGDGRFTLSVLRRLGRRGGSVTLLDRHDVVTEATRREMAALGWSCRVAQAEAGEALPRCTERFDAVFANLFLHQFPDDSLAAMLGAASRLAPLVAACEPRRSALAMGGARLLWAIGCGEVTRLDAAISVRAGFRGGEIGALWPERAGWVLQERPAGPFSHLFVARRA